MLQIGLLVRSRRRKETTDHRNFIWGRKGSTVGNKGWRWETMDEGQVEEQAVKLAGREVTGRKGWQRVWLDSWSTEEVTRDMEQCQSVLPPCFCLNELPASASSASGARETEAGMCRAHVEQHDPEEKDCVRSISHQFLCQKVQSKQLCIWADCYI